ncbi:SMP-30/gluconolactonase/LRE family protein [Variovorax sp. J22R115]|uniref:SMP-30/gluconolactonase/LRE family protein n=1 Tax=Variovorax sp. J22R115 TaxID=3053509 RepID=UPI002578B0B7|nr:SMP-30/gluconolactonase/LRE family protein [Variovorax sp. J22R115]MDM0053966.1 SMP-30/gluconolactonase/LRE family protein [Variovorax sp. J22R115]
MFINCLAMHKSELLSDYIGTLPECPTWSDRDGRLYWTDIVKKELHWVQPKTGEHKTLQFDEEVGCFALREKGGFILAMRSGIYLSDADGRIEKKVCDNPSNPSVARFNDGGVDQDGRFYAGTYWGPRDFNGALLCRVDSALRVRVLQCDILGANGLAFSPDRRWMYTTDTPNHVMYRTPLDPASGEPGLREVFMRFPTGNGRPDGAAMDVEACYWTALFNGHRIARISPSGEVIEEYGLPVRCPTMVCFGGDDMKTLFITTTRENMSADEIAERPLSGAIFALRTAVAGLRKPAFKELS